MGGRIPGAHREGKGVSRGACWTVYSDPLQLGERGEQAKQAIGATDRTRIQAHGDQAMTSIISGLTWEHGIILAALAATLAIVCIAAWETRYIDDDARERWRDGE